MLPSGINTSIKNIYKYKKEIKSAGEFEAVTFTLKNHVDLSRGDYIVDTKNPPNMSDQFRTDLIWMDIKEFLPGRIYLIKTQSKLYKARFF